MPPMPAVRPRIAELPRGCGLRKVRRAASDGRVHEAEGCAGQVHAMLAPASYRGCPKCPYVNHRETPAPTQRPVVSKPAPRLAPKRPEIRKPQPQPQKEALTPMEADVPRPSTSSAKPSYAAAVKNIAAKPVARKPKAPGKWKTPAAATGPKPAPKKPKTPKPGNRQKPRSRRPRQGRGPPG
ncbi:hypothetical protein Trydic_g646 [Trypoxylus dichotomus]